MLILSVNLQKKKIYMRWSIFAWRGFTVNTIPSQEWFTCFIYTDVMKIRSFCGFIERDEGGKFRSLLEFEVDEISYADG